MSLFLRLYCIYCGKPVQPGNISIKYDTVYCHRCQKYFNLSSNVPAGVYLPNLTRPINCDVTIEKLNQGYSIFLPAQGWGTYWVLLLQFGFLSIMLLAAMATAFLKISGIYDSPVPIPMLLLVWSFYLILSMFFFFKTHTDLEIRFTPDLILFIRNWRKYNYAKKFNLGSLSGITTVFVQQRHGDPKKNIGLVFSELTYEIDYDLSDEERAWVTDQINNIVSELKAQQQTQ